MCDQNTSTNDLKVFDSRLILDNDMFDPSQSMYIEASAGTGKTYTIQQIVARLIREKTPIEQILIVTYTEKAAGELKDRIRKKIEEVLETKLLIKEAEETALDDEQLALFEVALDAIDNVQIFTIHSFCQKTLNTYAYDAMRPFDMSLVSDELVKNVIAKWVRDHWPQIKDYRLLLLSNDGGDKAEANDVDKVVESIEKLFSGSMSRFYLDANGNIDERIISIEVPDEIPEEDISLASASNFDDLMKIEEFASIVHELEANPDMKWSQSTYRDLLEVLKQYQWGNGLYNANTFRVKADMPITQRLKAIKDKLSKLENYNKLIQYRFIGNQLKDLYQAWCREKKRLKAESYQDMIVEVHHAVMGDCGLCDRLREAYRYAIIDEFQDTNQLQWDIFKTVFLKTKTGDRVPEHAIYVVGDPKQSIYSFQGADVQVYQNAVREIGNGRKLGTNYRSTQSVLDACDALFSGDYFPQDKGIVFDSPQCSGKILEAQFNGEKTKPVWFACKIDENGIDKANVNDKEFARIAVELLVDSCSMDANGKTKLQIFDKDYNGGSYRNVKFSDFAILMRTRTELPAIESELKSFGIPFLRYKDANLFAGRECMEWIALYKAIDADDFSSTNRKLLNEVILTDFFPNRTADKTGYAKLTAVDDVYYDDPCSDERQMIARWHALARQYRWAELQETIYRESQVEKRLSSLSKLQEVSKLHQIGNYCVEYLYAHRCTIEELVKHLVELRKNSKGTDDADGNLVERGTDFDAVQIMTIHASKGLQFPVVIGVCGFKGVDNKATGPFIYHNEDRLTKLGYDDTTKNARQNEEKEEWRRLFYVAYTRAESLLILPKYQKWCNDFLKKSVTESLGNRSEICEMCYQHLDNEDIHRAVKAILSAHVTSNRSNELDEPEASHEEQLKNIAKLQKSVGGLSLIQHSYSSLAGKVRLVNVPVSQIDENNDIIGELPMDESVSSTSSDVSSADRYGDQSEPEETRPVRVPNVDKKPKPIALEETYVEKPICFPRDYPAGAMLGNAVHEVFEKVDFSDGRDTLELNELIRECFMRYGLDISYHEDWLVKTAEMVQNTLHAVLPEINGSKGTRKTFCLCELGENAHFAEVEFMLLANSEKKRREDYFTKGFIDLLFVRPDKNGNKRYSILDWKTDRLADDACYANPEKLKEKVDEEYSVQRVLYSYCLIEWLRKYYKDKTPEEIFDEHFGGIYYAFVRGTVAGFGNGIYAQTWKSYQELSDNYVEIKKLMFSSKTEEPENV